MFFVEALADFSSESVSQPGQQFISFKLGDKIYTKQTYDNGWWYGFKYDKDQSLDQQLNGYFPSNYVKKIEAQRPTEPHPSQKLQEMLAQEGDEEMIDYKKYAAQLREEENMNKIIHEILKEQTELIEAQKQIQIEQVQKAQEEAQKQNDVQLLEQKAQFSNYQNSLEEAQQMVMNAQQQIQQQGTYDMQRQFGVDGYKKIKVTADNKQSILANPEIKYDEGAEFAYVSIKKQGQVEKAYRQMGHYFDYEKWNDQVNQQGGLKKAKPDPSRKKDKKKEKMEKFLKSIN